MIFLDNVLDSCLPRDNRESRMLGVSFDINDMINIYTRHQQLLTATLFCLGTKKVLFILTNTVAWYLNIMSHEALLSYMLTLAHFFVSYSFRSEYTFLRTLRFVNGNINKTNLVFSWKVVFTFQSFFPFPFTTIQELKKIYIFGAG